MKKIFKRFLGKLGTEPLIRVHKLLFPHRGARMNIKTIKKDTGDVLFRGNDVKAETYKISKDKADEIEALHKEIQQAMQDLRGKEKAARHPLEVILRARQQIELLKVPVFVYLIKFYLDAGNSVVIFVNFNKTMKEITDHLLGDSDNTNEIITIDKIDFVRGGQSADERETIIDDFSKDKLRLLLCNIKAGGVGVSFHDIRGVYPRVSLISPTWAAIDLKQSLGRIYRANAKSDAKQRVIYCTAQSDTDNRNEKSFSIEEMICQNVNEKLQNISYINDGNLSSHVDMLDKKDMEEKLKNTSD
jgi:ERCC4-related helicase